MNINPELSRFFGRTLLQLQKHSPVILTTVGVAGVVTAGVLAAKATLKLEETLDTAELRLAHAKGTQQSKTKAMVDNTVDLVKLYGPSVTLGAASLVAIISAHGILHKRNVAMVAAYKGLETAYSNYRSRVVEAFGADVDRDFVRGISREEITDEKGKKKQVVSLANSTGLGDYTRIFGPDNPVWQGNEDYNLYFLESQQVYFNQLLASRGHVTLNEVLGKLGYDHTTAGFVTGWLWKGEGDGFIDFGIYDYLKEPMALSHEYPEKGVLLLDFNVDGVIYDKI